MGFAPLLSGWWVLILVGVVGLLLIAGVAAYVLLMPTKSAVTLPPRASQPMPSPVAMPAPMAMPVAMQPAWMPAAPSQPPPQPPQHLAHDFQPMTAPLGYTPPPAPVFVSPDATVPLTALTGDALDHVLIARAPKVDVPVGSPTSGPPAKSSKAPLPLRANATLVSATTPPSMPASMPPLPPAAKPIAPTMPMRANTRTLPPPASRVPAQPYSLAAMPPKKAAELLALQLDSDLPPAMYTPNAPDTERSLEEDDAPTMMTTWDSMSRGSA